MKRYGNFFDRLVSFENLMLAARKAFRGKKERQTVAAFYFNLENEVIDLRNELTVGSYVPRGFRIFEIREPKVRKICSSDFRDRVVHHAICNLLEPIFERRLIYDTYACRTNKGSHVALRRCQEFTRQYDYFLKCDIRKYFETIDHAVLKGLLRRILKDARLLSLLDQVIDHAVPGNPPGKGLPIGNLTSQHFANLYLGELDHHLKERLRVKGYVRYMDDFICFADDKADLHRLLEEIRRFTREVLTLELKDKVVRIAPTTEGVPFLGFRVYSNLIRIQRANLVRFRKKLKKKEVAYQDGRLSQNELIESTNSMIAHLSHANATKLRRKDNERSLHLA
jgi:RNA-directed DNA polymerase